MTEPLTSARFVQLAQAYGGDIERWPETERDAARAMAGQADLAPVLAQARQLDARLDLWHVPLPAAALRNRIVAQRPMLLSRRLRIWLSSLGIATALAGAAASTAALTFMLPVADHSMADDATAFGDLAPQEK